MAALHLLLVSSLAAKYEFDRVTRPRVWVKTVNYDPDLPIRGRYVSLQLEVETPTGLFEDKPLVEDKTPYLAYTPAPCPGQGPAAPIVKHRYRWESQEKPVRYAIEGGKLIAKSDPGSNLLAYWRRDMDGRVTVSIGDPVAFFIPENAQNPTRVKPGEQLWAEVTVPKQGPPRPIRLGIRHSNGEIAPLSLD